MGSGETMKREGDTIHAEHEYRKQKVFDTRSGGTSVLELLPSLIGMALMIPMLESLFPKVYLVSPAGRVYPKAMGEIRAKRICRRHSGWRYRNDAPCRLLFWKPRWPKAPVFDYFQRTGI